MPVLASARTGPRRRRRRSSRWIVAASATLVLTVLACGGETPAQTAETAVATVGAEPTAAAAETGTAPTPAEASAAQTAIVNRNGPDLVGLQEWFNSAPTTIGNLGAEGRVVLVDFWTYTCINCIRTLPFLREWNEKYGDRGLTILGIHSPEFEFEKVAENVQAAIERYGLQYPVAQDNDMATWDAFGNRFWPAKYLFDTSGKIIYTHFGEGEYVATELEIRKALEAAGHDVADIPVGDDDGPKRDPAATGITRELYGGYARNYSRSGLYAGQEQYYNGPDSEVLYEDNVPHTANRFYLQGLWRNEREAIVHARATQGYEDYIAVPIVARSVVVVISPPEPEAFDVVIELDGRPLEKDEAGSDVVWDSDGRSVIRVTEPREYRIVELNAFGEHDLKLRSNSPNFAVFAFTFGIYTEGA